MFQRLLSSYSEKNHLRFRPCFGRFTAAGRPGLIYLVSCAGHTGALSYKTDIFTITLLLLLVKPKVASGGVCRHLREFPVRGRKLVSVWRLRLLVAQGRKCKATVSDVAPGDHLTWTLLRRVPVGLVLVSLSWLPGDIPGLNLWKRTGTNRMSPSPRSDIPVNVPVTS